jgi:hypothetical protein
MLLLIENREPDCLPMGVVATSVCAAEAGELHSMSAPLIRAAPQAAMSMNTSTRRLLVCQT